MESANHFVWLFTGCFCNFFQLRDQEGYLLRFTLTKNIHTGSPHSFALIQFIHPEVCPVAWVRYYIMVCQCLGNSLDQGYFFKVTECNGSVGNNTFMGSEVSNLEETPFRVQTLCKADSALFSGGIVQYCKTFRLLPGRRGPLLGLENWGSRNEVYAAIGY